jgi:hypothetical protein
MFRDQLPDNVYDGKPRPVFEKKKKRKRKAPVVVEETPEEPTVVVDADSEGSVKKVKSTSAEPILEEPIVDVEMKM